MRNQRDFSNALRPAPPDGATILARERSRSSIDIEELSHHLLTKAWLGRQDRILKVISAEKLFSKHTQAHLSRPDRYKLGLARGKRLRQLSITHGWDDEDYKIAEYLVDDVLPYHLHTAMFIAAVRQQSSDEQRRHWMPKMDSWEIIGAYAQTELGHGSNVRGIETEARWDQSRKEFVLHSPTLTASKWWNGTLGRTANYAVVIAQLMLPNGNGSESGYRSYGPHPFIVQIRDMQTHQPPKSIIVGDIGPKFGYAPMDNAYLLFNHHKIPHSAMLSRYSRIDPDTGTYTKPTNPSSIYSTMTRNRSIIVLNARLALARAVTVAVRYLAIRRQFTDKDNPGAELEVPGLDYSTVQIRVLPLLATTFALHYSGRAMWQLYERSQTHQELDGDRETLAELHSTSSGLKSLATGLTADGIEVCRRAMGGHGYMASSGLVQLLVDYSSKPTVEGDNWMITQQVAQYLVKKAKEIDMARSLKTRPRSRTEQSLSTYTSSKGRRPLFRVLEDDAAIVSAFEWRAAHMTFLAYEAREVQKRSWNSLLVDFHKLSIAYSQSLLVIHFYTAIQQETQLSPESRGVLLDLFKLFAYTTLDSHAREFFSSGAMSNEDLDSLPGAVLKLMQRIRPHAVRLVDAWKIPDYLLDSALGRFDGRVYEDLFERAHRQNPLNELTFNPDYRTDEIVLGSGDQGKIMSKL